MQKIIDLFFKLLEFLVVACLVAMVIMVFGNVVLRYGFNSGISISDEMSRYCFIWLTYLGAMVAMREKGHLGVDTLVRRLSNNTLQPSIITSLKKKQSFLPPSDKRRTSVSTPRCPFSRMAKLGHFHLGRDVALLLHLAPKWPFSRMATMAPR